MFTSRDTPHAAARALLLLGLAVGGCSSASRAEPAPEARKGAGSSPGAARSGQAVSVPARAPQLPTFPCVEQCHKDRVPDLRPRALSAFHSTKRVVHGDPNTWCNRCHDLANLDQLRTLDGRPLSFDQAFELCGQCHGDKKRDWDTGIHGLQTGAWNGVKVRRSCTACHDPHAPRRPTFEALPAPTLHRESSHE